ncbi:GspE/PulE family protein [Neptunomonas phycophila]|uniref:GspE/PulE family protein n=1 Tax=Neptunomonas phycophila TaxID=1572645 RepID=UPI0035198ADE
MNDFGEVHSMLHNKPLPSSITKNILFADGDIENRIFVVMPVDATMQEKLAIGMYADPLKPIYKTVEDEEFNRLKTHLHQSTNYNETEAEELFNELFELAVSEKASDIHIFSYPNDPHILLRINGELERIQLSKKFTSERLIRLSRAILGSMTGNSSSNKNSFQPALTQNATVEEKKSVEGNRYRLRYQDAELDGDESCIHVTMRLLDLDRDFSNGSLCDLGYEQDQQDLVYEVMMKGGGGIIVVVGATGDGKTTTAATMLGKIATDHQGRKMIITVEDPVEFKIPGVHHTQVQPLGEEKAEKAWERHLSAMMRRDPDFILQGEMRSEMTAKSAAHAALTGHTTMVTLHGNSAFDAFTRMNELGIESSLLSSEGFVKGVIFQRLLPKICPDCSHRISAESDPSEGIRFLIDHNIASRSLMNRLITSYGGFISNIRFRNIEGCPSCRKGLVGRVAVAETLYLDSEVRKYIAEGKIDQARKQWMDQKMSSPILDSEKSIESQYPQHCVGFSAFDHAIKKMLYGLVSPIDVEDKLGVISKSEILSDHTFTGDEVARMTGACERKD